MRCGSEEGQGFGNVRCYEEGDSFVNIAQARIFFFFSIFQLLHRALVIQNPAGTDLPTSDMV